MLTFNLLCFDISIRTLSCALKLNWCTVQNQWKSWLTVYLDIPVLVPFTIQNTLFTATTFFFLSFSCKDVLCVCVCVHACVRAYEHVCACMCVFTSTRYSFSIHSCTVLVMFLHDFLSTCSFYCQLCKRQSPVYHLRCCFLLFCVRVLPSFFLPSPPFYSVFCMKSIGPCLTKTCTVKFVVTVHCPCIAEEHRILSFFLLQIYTKKK